jgi:hypothetical protein
MLNKVKGLLSEIDDNFDEWYLDHENTIDWMKRIGTIILFVSNMITIQTLLDVKSSVDELDELGAKYSNVK